MFERQDNHAVSKNADHDRGHTVEQIRGVTHDKSHRAPAEFREIDGAEEPDGHAKERSEKKQFGAAEDGVGHAPTRLANGSGQLSEKVPANGSSTVENQVAEDKTKHGDRDEGAHSRHGQHEAAHEFAPAQTGAHARAVSLPRFEVTRISRRASPLRMKELGRASCRESGEILDLI